MSKKEFSKHLKSNDSFGDEYFEPSSAVWDNIDGALQDEEKRKNGFFPIYILLTLIGVGSAFFYLGNTFYSDYNQLTLSAEVENQQSAPVLQKEPLLIVEEKVTAKLVPHEENYIEPEVTSNIRVGKNIKMVYDINNSDVTPVVLASEDAYNDEKVEEIKGNHKINSHFVGIENAPTTNEEYFSISTKDVSSQILHANSLNDAQDIREGRSLLIFEPLQRSLDNNISKREFIFPALNSKIIQNEKVNLPWLFEISGFSSWTEYNIEQHSSFEDLSFDLQGEWSRSHSIKIGKHLSRNILAKVGFGIDDSHFNANYSLSYSHLSLQNQGETDGLVHGTLDRNIPSLAGGLTSRYLVSTTTRSTFNSSEFDMQLSHNYRTIFVPIEIMFQFLKKHNWEVGIGLGIQYSKRLLTIDTGVEFLQSQDDAYDISLTDVGVIELDYQPFRIHNVSNQVLGQLLYNIKPNVSLGIEGNVSKPWFDIYNDHQYSVSSMQYNIGMNIRYTLF